MFDVGGVEEEECESRWEEIELFEELFEEW